MKMLEKHRTRERKKKKKTNADQLWLKGLEWNYLLPSKEGWFRRKRAKC